MDPKKLVTCQSCGMPMNDAKNFGTNSDKSKSNEYCSFCFTNGKFTDDGITMEEKIEKNIKIAVQMGISENKAIEMAKTVIPTLKRWQK